jgi:hypothetical protein
LHAAGQTQGAENTVFSFAYPGKKAMSREIFPGKFYAAAKNGGIALNLPFCEQEKSFLWAENSGKTLMFQRKGA